MNLGRTLLITLLIAISSACYGGAWGVGSFENDSALDWVYELQSSNFLPHLKNSFDATKGAAYLEVDVCSVALAAADIVASIRTKSSDHLPVDVQSWIKANSTQLSPELVQAAVSAVAQCRDETKSELAQLWQESSANEWSSYISGLEARLK